MNTPVVPFTWGDVDCSGSITIGDVLAILKYASGTGTGTPPETCPVVQTLMVTLG